MKKLLLPLFTLGTFGATLCEAKNPAQCTLIIETLEKSYQQKRDAFIAAMVEACMGERDERAKIAADYIVACSKMRVQILQTQTLIAAHLAANYPQSLSQLSVRLERLYEMLTSDIRGLVTPATIGLA